MSLFDFRTRTISIKSLELTSDDNPTIEFKGDRVVLTASRGGEHIKIVAQIPQADESVKKEQLKVLTPVPVVTTVKTPVSRNSHPLKGVTLPSSDKRAGENNHLSKLTIQKVLEIRELATDPDIIKAYGSRTNFCVEIGKAYNVHFTTIANILNRVSWKHI